MTVGIAVLALGGGLGAAIPLVLFPDQDIGRASAEALVKRQSLPPCSAGGPPGDCRLGSAVVRTTNAPKPVVMPDIEVRALRASLTGRRLDVRVRVRNGTDRLQEVNAVGRQLRVRLAGRDHEARMRAEPLLLASGEAATMTLRFPLGRKAATAFRTQRRPARLIVRPFAAQRVGGPARRLGVIRFGRRS